MSSKTQWPDSLKSFISRAYALCDMQHRAQVEKELKQIITNAFEKNLIWSTDWNNMVLPALEQSQPPPQSARSSVLDSNGNNKKKSGDQIGFTPEKNNSTRKTNNQLTSASPERQTPLADFVPFEDVAAFGGRRISKRKSIIEGDDLDEDTLRQQRQMRAKRFGLTKNVYNPSTSASPREGSVERDSQPTMDRPLVGRSKQLEKKYLRLTSAPDPDTVRPLPILRQSLELLKRKWKTEHNYAYICDQFKSMRQDLTVQRIQNEFSVSVYEIHARIALEMGDLGEYNQCQSQLKSLYSEGIEGHPLEFLAYRLLYLLYTRNVGEINELLAELTHEELADPSVRHALRVRHALNNSNYHILFKLYEVAPNMSGFVMDSFIPRQRLSALATICKAYKPDISIEMVSEELKFDNLEECLSFIQEQGAGHTVSAETRKINTKDAFPIFFQAAQQAVKKVDIKGQI